MPVCKSCGDEVDELVSAKIDGKNKKVCEDCASLAEEQSQVAEASEQVVRGMMEFKGKR